jgi:hypothetical protein
MIQQRGTLNLGQGTNEKKFYIILSWPLSPSVGKNVCKISEHFKFLKEENFNLWFILLISIDKVNTDSKKRSSNTYVLKYIFAVISIVLPSLFRCKISGKYFTNLSITFYM